MKICYQRDGGLAFLPGLQRPIEFEAEAMEPPRREALARLVGECGFFAQPVQVGQAPKGAADHTAEILTIEEAGERHRVRIVGTPSDAALAALLAIVREEVAQLRSRR